MNFDKAEIKSKLTEENIFELLQEWGGDPEYQDNCIISRTICHNDFGEGSRKLYYYYNSRLFQCYSNCGSFDIFELLIKVADIQWGKSYDLNEAVQYIAFRFGISGSIDFDAESKLEDWKILEAYDRVQNVEIKNNIITLKEYDPTILKRLAYNVKIAPWLNEGIAQSALDKAQIGFYPGGDQITIPHFDINNRFIGLRGRALCAQEAEKYGKYRPITINGQMYNHPLGANLYNLNNSKENIASIKKAIVFESEKSTLLYQTYFDSDISVACCGSNLSNYQVQLLLNLGVDEIIVAFDRQFQEIGDKEFKHLTKGLTSLHNKYKNYVRITFMFDKHMTTSYKASPIDEGKEKFIQLFNERISL
jgi:hypothetical protein